MRKLSLLTLILVLSTYGTTFCQVHQLYTATYQLRAKVNLVKNELKPYSFSSGVTAILKNDELHFHYPLQATKDFEYYKVSFSAQLNGKDFTPPAHYLKGDLGKQEIEAGQQKRSITWFGLTNLYQQLEGNLSLFVHVTFYGDKTLPYEVSCLNPPKFEFRQKLPFYGVGVIGVGSLVAGQIYLKKGEDKFRKHLVENVISERKSLYERADQQTTLAEVLTYAGIGILVADGIGYYLRKRRHKKQVKIFEENCANKSISFQPILDFSTTSSQNIGFQLSYTF